MLLDLSVTELVHLVNQPVEEVTVMGYHNQCAIICLQCLLEDFLRLDVHMVGRLVQSQEVVRLEHELRHAETGPFPSGKDTDLLVDILSPEKELREDVPQFGPYLPYCNPVQGLPYGKVAVKDILLILGIITQGNIISSSGFPLDGSQFSGNHPHERGLAFTVASDQCYLIPPLDLNIRITENYFPGVSDGYTRRFENDVSGSW